LERNIDKVYSFCEKDKKIAEIKNLEEEGVREQLIKNAQTLFKLV
jgi:hypothetical protein